VDSRTAIITLTTDFGYSDPFVGIMKGAILCIAPDLQIIDLNHGIPAQDIRAAALNLAA
jgi:S-adenosyl-L-methionine hydrolase (adenosine-forming)